MNTSSRIKEICKNLGFSIKSGDWLEIIQEVEELENRVLGGFDVQEPNFKEPLFRFLETRFNGAGDHVLDNEELQMKIGFCINPPLRLHGKIPKTWVGNVKGVYALVLDNKILYIGKAKRIRSRIIKHFQTQDQVVDRIYNSGKGVSEIWSWLHEYPEQIERFLIEKYNPEFNIEFRL